MSNLLGKVCVCVCDGTGSIEAYTSLVVKRRHALTFEAAGRDCV